MLRIPQLVNERTSLFNPMWPGCKAWGFSNTLCFLISHESNGSNLFGTFHIKKKMIVNIFSFLHSIYTQSDFFFPNLVDSFFFPFIVGFCFPFSPLLLLPHLFLLPHSLFLFHSLFSNSINESR